MNRHNESKRSMPQQRPQWRALAVAMLAASLAACAVGPDYVRPKMDLPQNFKEEAGWQPAKPRDAEPRGKWWEVYGDAQLNSLMEQVQVNNQNVRQAEAQYREARATAQEARAAFYPTVSAGPGVSRQSSNTVSPVTGQRTTSVNNSYSATLDASWEPDLWGKIRRQVEAGNATAAASKAELASALLSAQSELAQDYFGLRALDSQADLYKTSIDAFQRSLQITKNQFAVGIVTKADVAVAETQLLTTQAQAIDLGVQRAQFEHAIAILIGKAPSEFSLAPAPLTATLPAIPADGMPSDLLERRPDIAAAERQVVAANANIGVARAAYYPSFSLTASGGLEGTTLPLLINSPARIWSLGAALSETLFDGGLRGSQNDAAVAAYDATVAAYKQTVLGGLQEVEDNLVALRVLETEAKVQHDAVKASQVSTELALNQYKAGTATYLTVVTAQTTELSDERSEIQLIGRQFTSHVLLIAALGGSAQEEVNSMESGSKSDAGKGSNNSSGNGQGNAAGGTEVSSNK